MRRSKAYLFADASTLKNRLLLFSALGGGKTFALEDQTRTSFSASFYCWASHQKQLFIIF
jgi:hypothetical protein